MHKRPNVLGVGVRVGLVVGMLAMASGCVAPTENQAPAEAESDMSASDMASDVSESDVSDSETGTVSQAVNTAASCSYAANGQGTAGLKEAQKRSTQALKYILGGSDIAGCDRFKAHANVIRFAIRARQLNITATGSTLICDTVAAKRIRMTEALYQSERTKGTLWTAIHALAEQGGETDKCFGRGASTFFVLQTNADQMSTGKFRNWVEFDPSLASLTAHLLTRSTGASARAAAQYSDGTTTVAFRWSAGGSSCNSAYAGLSCTTSSSWLFAGTPITKSIVNYDGYCYCQ